MTSSRFNRTPEKTSRARRLRRDVTEVEKKLWLHLRGRQINRVAFRRQHPIEAYIVDFCAPSLKLIIELDGGQHNAGDGKARDDERTSRLNALGFHVLRFWNNDVMENVDGVLQKIAEITAEQKTPLP